MGTLTLFYWSLSTSAPRQGGLRKGEGRERSLPEAKGAKWSERKGWGGREELSGGDVPASSFEYVTRMPAAP